MDDNNGTERTQKSEKNEHYVRTFREGPVAANIFRRTAAGGLGYFDFSLSRAWKSPEGKEGYSRNFFTSNRDAIHTVVDQACDFIEGRQITTEDEEESRVSEP